MTQHQLDLHQLLADRKQVAVIWCIEDVQSVRPKLTDEECWKVLQQCKRLHDCEIGFNWHLIEFVADDLFRTSESSLDEGGQP